MQEIMVFNLYPPHRGKFKPITRKRVGLAGFKAPARAHTEVFDPSGNNKVSLPGVLGT